MLADLLSSTHLPNLHPAVLHFPIALLSIAVLTEICSLAFRRPRWLEPMAVALYLLGSLSALASWFTGRMAADSVGWVPWETQEAMSEHSDFALRALLIFALMSLARLALSLFQAKLDTVSYQVLRSLLLIVALFGSYLLMETADRGGALVYTHGVAVMTALTTGSDSDGEAAQSLAEPPLEVQAASPSEPPTPLARSDSGELSWTPTAWDLQALGEIIDVVEASPGAQVQAVLDSAAREGLTLEVSGRLYLLLPEERGDVDVRAVLDADDFEGSIGLVHHFAGIDDYECMTLLESGDAVLLTVTKGKALQLDNEAITAPSGQHQLAVSAAGSHLKGFVDGRTVVHGHRGVGTPPGRVGLILDGQGLVRVVTIRVAEATKHH